jgi:hypothetical protein
MTYFLSMYDWDHHGDTLFLAKEAEDGNKNTLALRYGDMQTLAEPLRLDRVDGDGSFRLLLRDGVLQPHKGVLAHGQPLHYYVLDHPAYDKDPSQFFSIERSGSDEFFCLRCAFSATPLYLSVEDREGTFFLSKDPMLWNSMGGDWHYLLLPRSKEEETTHSVPPLDVFSAEQAPTRRPRPVPEVRPGSLGFSAPLRDAVPVPEVRPGSLGFSAPLRDAVPVPEVRPGSLGFSAPLRDALGRNARDALLFAEKKFHAAVQPTGLRATISYSTDMARDPLVVDYSTWSGPR